SSSDLNYAATNSLTLPGGATIKDSLNNDANVTLPATNAGNSLAGNKDIVIDTPAAVTNVASPTADGTYGLGAPIDITVQFTKSVDVTGTPQLTLNSGGTAQYLSGSGTNTLTFHYVVGSGENSLDLGYTSTSALGLNGGTIVGSGGSTAADLTLPTPGT